jgi:hypothetical protein
MLIPRTFVLERTGSKTCRPIPFKICSDQTHYPQTPPEGKDKSGCPP